MLMAFAPLYGQEPFFVQQDESKPWEFSLRPDHDEEIKLYFLIQQGFHIQADQVRNENLIPTTLSWEEADGVQVGSPRFPMAKELEMEGMEEPLVVFSDTLEIRVPIKLRSSAQNPPLLLKGKLYYQPCDHFKCYFPRDLDFDVKIDRVP